MEPTYSIKEILDIQFKGIDHKLDGISHVLKEQNLQTERRFTAIERELEDIKKKQETQGLQQAKYNTLWGIGATVGASLVAFMLNRLF